MYYMAKLQSVHLSKVQTSGLARVGKAASVVDAVTAIKSRLALATLVTVQQVLDRTAVSGVVLAGLAQANVLTGADGTGRPHCSVRSNFYLCTQADIDTFIAGLASLQTVEEVQAAYYSFVDEYAINGVIWDNEESWKQRGNQGTFTGYLRADGTTGDVSISGLTAEKPAVVLAAKKMPSLNASIPVSTPSGIPAPPQAGSVPPPPPAAPAMKLLNGTAYSAADLLANNYTQAQIDALPNA